jgi:hypothetical protein
MFNPSAFDAYDWNPDFGPSGFRGRERWLLKSWPLYFSFRKPNVQDKYKESKVAKSDSNQENIESILSAQKTVTQPHSSLHSSEAI